MDNKVDVKNTLMIMKRIEVVHHIHINHIHHNNHMIYRDQINYIKIMDLLYIIIIIQIQLHHDADTKTNIKLQIIKQQNMFVILSTLLLTNHYYQQNVKPVSNQ